MIGLELIERAIKVVLLSAYLLGEKPVSLLIMSKVESGKSSLLARFSNVPNIVMPSDITAWGIARHYARDIRDGKIRHILIPEFSIPINRNWDTVRSLDAFLCGLIEEGVGEIVSHRWVVRCRAPYGCGIVACISNQDYKALETKWFRIGLISRLIPLSYDYSQSTRKRIMEYIKRREYISESMVSLDIPANNVYVDLPAHISDSVEKLTEKLVTGTEMYGFRWQRHLQRMAMAHALLEKRLYVNSTDLDFVAELCEYVNTDCRKQV